MRMRLDSHSLDLRIGSAMKIKLEFAVLMICSLVAIAAVAVAGVLSLF